MSLRDVRRHVGRLAIVGFSGTSVPDDLRRLVKEFDLAGIIYFARNVESPEQIRELSRELTSLAIDWPLWVSVDQEGGRVARLKRPFTEWPPMATLGRSGDEQLVDQFGRALASELRAVGITLDFAPDLDVLTNPKNTAIGDRALSSDAVAAARLARPIIRAFQSTGIAACGKHFPGHGDTVADSHDELPIVEQDRRRLASREYLPFRAAIEERIAMIMTAHVLIPAIDERRPATLSPTVVTDMLKGELRFDGVVVTDDLGMKAVSATRPLGEVMIDAVDAGCDVALLCNSTADEQAMALETVVKAVESAQLKFTRIDDAFRRQHDVKARFAASQRTAVPPLDVVGCEAHQVIARQMASWL